jgi:hypothetical protein
MIVYKIILGHSGTRHIFGNPLGLQSVQEHAFRITMICGFGVRPEDALPLSRATRDCEFCLAELAVIEQRQQRQQDADHAA